MADLMLPVNTAVAVPVNVSPLLDDTDFKSIEDAVAYDASGMALAWNFVTPAGVVTQTAVTPTTGGGDYDWAHKGGGMYATSIPASGGASVNNNASGVGWFSGVAGGVVPWRGPTIAFVPAHVVGGLVAGTDKLEVDAAEIGGTAQTGQDIGATLGAPAGASVSADVAAVKGDTAAIKAKTDNLPATPADEATVAAVGLVVDDLPTLAEIEASAVLAKEATVAERATPAQVNAEVLDVLNVDTFAEPGQEAPPATTTLVKKIGYLYKAFRNRITQDASTLRLFNDAGTVVDQKATTADDGTTYTRGKIGTGP
jgi:hypothetical protein